MNTWSLVWKEHESQLAECLLTASSARVKYNTKSLSPCKLLIKN